VIEIEIRRTASLRTRLCAFLALVLAIVTSNPVLGEELGGCFHTIANLGRGGDSSTDLIARLNSDIPAESADLVVVLVGTNDLLNSRKAVSVETYGANLRVLVEKIVRKNIKVLLVTIPPAHAPYLVKRHGGDFYGAEGPGARIAAGNEMIHHIAQEKNLPVVELFDAFQNAGGASEHPSCLIRNLANSGSEDGVHPTAEGYRVLGTLVADVIVRENLQSSRRIVCFGDSITRGVHMTGEGTAAGDTYPSFLARALTDGYLLSSESKR
jgi:lysophospholipase L1-like esterase